MNEDYEYLMDNHIRNLQRLTNGKSAHENYIDFLNQRRETVDRINRLSVAQIIGQVQSSEDFIAIDSFLKDSFFGQLIIAGVAPAIRILIIEAVNKNSK